MASRFKITNKRKVKWLYSLPSLVVLLIIVGVSVQATVGLYTGWEETRSNRAQAATELDDLKSREARLEAQLARLETRQGSEAEIRDKFSVAKPGEEVVIIVDSQEPAPDTAQSEDGSWWSWITKIF